MVFRFKQFEVSHALSAHKVGVDGVLLGAWAQCPEDADNLRILDVGCGCGLIALMMAQRYPAAHVTAIDVHKPSICEAERNVAKSAWEDRIEVCHCSLEEYLEREEVQGRFDAVVSNPPYFNSGVNAHTSDRLRARHCAELSPTSLIIAARQLLKPSGTASLIMPSIDVSSVLETLPAGMAISRMARVRDNEHKPPKRVMLELMRGSNESVQESLLTLHNTGHNPSAEYLELCHEFYLAF